MHKYLLGIMGLLVVLLSSCSDSLSETVTYKINEPVFMSNEAFRSSVKVSTGSVAITNFGKICFYNGYLYISESGKGIHIIDNTNPADPKNIGFIELLGNADLSIRNNLLYADSYIDLVWFDVTIPAAPVLKGRLEDVFPKALPAIENNYGFDYEMCYNESTDKGVVVGWELKDRTESIDNYTGGWYWNWGNAKDDLYTSDGAMAGNSVHGSMSRFTLYDSKLYAVTENYMTIFDVSNEQPVKATESVYVGWNVETIFSYEDNLFMGTPTGMIIYSVTDPLKPEWQSSISHVYGCDPVVVDNDLAYITVHSGNLCGQDSNQLIIVDVSNVKIPKQVATFKMTSPKGLGVDNNMLFLCDDGLKIYNIETPANKYISSIKQYAGMAGYDLIPYNNTLMMIAEDGLYQYNYADVNNINFLSKLPF